MKYKNNAQTGKPDLVTTLTTELTDITTLYVPYSGANANVNIGAHSMSAQSGAITGTAGAGYQTFIAQSANPSAPAAGTLLLHSSTTNGFTRMEQDNEAATNLVYSRDEVFIAKNTSGGTIAKGQPVYVTGSTGNVPNIGLARSNSTTTLPSIGVALDSIGNNNFGQIMKQGIVSSIDTSAYTAGDSLWVSTSSAGALQNTRPAYPNFVQRIGTVLVSGVGNGSILVVTSPFVGGMESGTNAATFTATSFVGSFSAGMKTAYFSRDVSTATGTQAVTGVGFRPSYVQFIAVVDATSRTSNGVDNGTTTNCVYSLGSTSSIDVSNSIHFYTSAGVEYTGKISSLDSDGFTISWTKSGGTTGTGYIIYHAFR